MGRKFKTTQKKNLLIRMRPDTRRKVEVIAIRQRWTLCETVDALADFFMDQRDIPAQRKTENVLEAAGA